MDFKNSFQSCQTIPKPNPATLNQNPALLQPLYCSYRLIIMVDAYKRSARIILTCIRFATRHVAGAQMMKIAINFAIWSRSGTSFVWNDRNGCFEQMIWIYVLFYVSNWFKYITGNISICITFTFCSPAGNVTCFTLIIVVKSGHAVSHTFV